MNIIFKLIDEQSVAIIDSGNGNQVGQIFTPSGTSHDVTSAIQVCGFDEAFDLWGCGIFCSKVGKKAKKDIQLLFSKDSIKDQMALDLDHGCAKCYCNPCNCKELRVKSLKEVLVEKM